jgi:ABC-2 type transport system permease protein
VLTLLVVWLRVWVASHIKLEAFLKFFSQSLKFFQGLLPVPIEDLASPLGRVAFTYEEFALLLLMGMWTVTRGSDCLAGRLGAGTMEMLLAQPISRLAVIVSHTLVTLAGVAAIGVASWLGIGLGLLTGKFDETPHWLQLIPGTVVYISHGVFVVGAATLSSAIARSRSQAVGLVLGFYIIEIALMIVGRLTRQFDWMEWLTVLSAYEPTKVTLGLARDAAKFGPIFWQHNACLVGLGALALGVAAAVFCHRDVPAPL